MAPIKELEDEDRRLKKMQLEQKLKAEIANEYLASV
jgi:putative transposase